MKQKCYTTEKYSIESCYMPRYPLQGLLSQKPRRIRLPSIENNLQANPPPNVLPYFTAWLIDGNSIGVNTYPRELLMTNLQGMAFITPRT